MKNIKKIVSTALIGLIAFSAVGCNMIAKTDAAVKKSPIAKVNKTTITRGQLDEQLAPVIAQMKLQGIDPASDQGKETLDQYRQQTIDNLITLELFKQKIKEKNIITDAKLNEEVDKQFADYKKNFKDDTEFTDQLKQYNITQAQLKELIKADVIQTKIYEYLTKDVTVQDKDIQDYYAQNPYEFTEQPNMIHVAHILTDTEDAAKAAKARLDKGEDFAKVANEVSKDTEANKKGGDLGEQPYVGGNLDKIFMTCALSLKKGETSNPVQTSFGWHIIRVLDKKEYAIKKLDAVKATISEKLLTTKKSEEFNKQVEKWKSEATIETKKYEKNIK